MDNLIFEPTPFTNHKRYMDDLNDSQGFYLSPDTDGAQVPAGVRRAIGEYSSGHNRRAEIAAKYAVEEHNKKEGETESLQFVRMLNLNVQPTAGALYYITMAAEVRSSGETRHYQAKVWETLNGRYQVKIFRLAPYWLNSSDKIANNFFVVGIDKLLPWMDESYIYYKCFFRARMEVLGVEIIRNEEDGSSRALIRFRNCEDAKESLSKCCAGKTMPYTTNKPFSFP